MADAPGNAKHKDEAGAVVDCALNVCEFRTVEHLREDVPAFHYMIACAGGDTLRCARYATFGTAQLSHAMLKALQQRSACLLANHGAIVFGPDLQKALWLAGEIEALCKQYFAARQLGEPVVLGGAEMKRVLARFRSYGKQAHELGRDDMPAVDLARRRNA